MSEILENSVSENDDSNHTIEYVGTVGGLLPIVIHNTILTLLTLGIYRFWAKTDIRKYLWSKTKFDGEPFEYTGTGGELFVGFLIVFFVAFLPLMIGMGYLVQQYPTTAPYIIGAFYPLFIFLIGVAVYRAQVYRMSRTNWRRIRGAQLKGSAAYGWLTLKYAVLYFITFGLITPYVICRSWNFLINNKRLGSGVMSCNVKSKPLFKVWFLSWLAAIVIFGATIGLISYGALTSNIVFIVLGYLVMFFAFEVIFVWFKAALLNHLFGGLRYQNMAFNFHIAPMELLTFSIVNFLILLFTLGLGASFITQRWTRLICEKLSFEGKLDFAEISQSPEQGPNFGEGLVEAFDIG